MRNESSNRILYRHRPIASVDALARALAVPDVSARRLRHLADTADSYYRISKTIPKPDGSKRVVHDVRPPLKAVQSAIHEKLILGGVKFPDYLSGGIKGRSTLNHVAPHVGARMLIAEDISDFFPSITFEEVMSIWMYVFRFPIEISDLLSRLTTLHRRVPQGASTSMDIGNLVLHRREHILVETFIEQGIAYTRFADDIAASARRQLTPEEIVRVRAALRRLLGSAGLKPKASKRNSAVQGQRMVTTGLLVNRHPAVLREYEIEVWKAVKNVACLSMQGERSQQLLKAIQQASGKIQHLNRTRPSRAARYTERLASICAQLET